MSLARRWLLPGLLAGALIRAAALPYPGTEDVTIWKTWAFGASEDLTASYGVGGTPPERREIVWQTRRMTVDYPPLALVELDVAGRVFRHIDPAFEDSPKLNALVKAPGVLWELLLVGVLLTWGRRRFGDDVAAGLALSWWLNPAVIVNGALLGYLDLPMAVPAALSLFAAWDGVLWLSAALLLVALLTKAQAVFAAPVIAVVAIARAPRHWRAFAVAGVVSLAILAAAIGPFALRGALPNLRQGIASLARHDMLSANAANVWWVITWVLRVQDMIPEWGWWRSLTQETHILAISSMMNLGYPNPRQIGMAIVVPLSAWGLWRARRATSLAVAAAATAWCAHSYIMFAAQVHENHMALLLPCVAVAGTLDRRLRAVCWTLTAITALNLLLFYGMPVLRPLGITRQSTVIDATVWLALANLAAWVWHTAVLVRITPAAATSPAGPG